MGEMVMETQENRREMSKKKYEQWLQKVHRVRVASDARVPNKEIAQMLGISESSVRTLLAASFAR